MADLRAKRKKRQEDKKLKVRVNNIKRKEMGVRCTSYNSSRVFSTVIPEFTIGDKVTNRPVTVGEKLKSTREDWIIDEMDNRKAKCTNVHNPIWDQGSILGRLPKWICDPYLEVGPFPSMLPQSMLGPAQCATWDSAYTGCGVHQPMPLRP